MRKKKRNINFENVSLQSNKNMILYNCPKETATNKELDIQLEVAKMILG